MKILNNASILIALFLLATAAEAQNRVFVSAVHGDDTNNCSAVTPCRSFAHAITVVATDGEILALDSGGYGPVTIGIGVSIVGPRGVEASVTQTASQNAIEVNASGSAVILRGLNIFGLGGVTGIHVTAADTIAVQSCNINGFSANGIEVDAAAVIRLTVTDTTVSHCTQNGIITAGSPTAFAEFEIDHVHLENNGFSGLNLLTQSEGAIRYSFATGGTYGIIAQSQVSGELTFLTIENCTITLNSTGISVGANAGSVNATVSNSVISHNVTGINNFSGANAGIFTRQNNTITANVAGSGSFTGTFAAQ